MDNELKVLEANNNLKKMQIEKITLNGKEINDGNLITAEDIKDDKIQIKISAKRV